MMMIGLGSRASCRELEVGNAGGGIAGRRLNVGDMRGEYGASVVEVW